MRFIFAAISGLFLFSSIPSSTHVFWYKAITNGYNLQANPGPNLPAGAIVHQGMIMSATLNQRNNAQEASFVIGSGLDDAQGRCGVVWSKELCTASGVATLAKVRAEYRDSWSGSFSSPGPISIRCGVVDFQGNIDAHGGIDSIPETATWADALYPLAATMGYNAENSTALIQEETINITVPPGKVSGNDDGLSKQFMEVDVTDQVNWILAHTGSNKGSYSGQYAIVFLVAIGQGSVGKINTYSAENGVIPAGSDSPWTTDGNTMHLVVTPGEIQCLGCPGCIGCPGAVESRTENRLSGINLGTAMPNPFTGNTSIFYNTGAHRSASINIYGPDGRLVHSRNVAGQGSMNWDASAMPMGLYVCRLTAGSRSVARTLIVAK